MNAPCTLKLKGGQEVLIDERDHARLSRYDYRLSGGEAVRTLPKPDAEGRPVIRPLKYDVLRRHDVAARYADGNPLNSTRANIEIVRDPKKSHVTQLAKRRAEGVRPSVPLGHSTLKFHSSVPGVTYRKDRAASKPWRVRVQLGGKTYYLGHFATREQAEAVASEAYGA